MVHNKTWQNNLDFRSISEDTQVQKVGLKAFDARATITYFARSTINAHAAERKEITDSVTR